jgi:2-methylisocitrate lyase-like PEP mutase family enzyme
MNHHPLPDERRAEFARLLSEGRTLLVPGCHDALSAILVVEAGMPLVYVGSYATAASAFGLPDVGVLGLDDLVGLARRIVDAVPVPVVADAEGGFYDAPNIWRTVRAFEQAGVVAVHIEDHAGGKHTDLPQRLIPLDDMVAKIRAAREARTDPGFQIIARTDAIWATKDFDEARRRLAALSEAGADLLFPTGATPEMLSELKSAVPGKYVAVDGPGHPSFSGKATAADLVLYYGFSLFAATRGMTTALARYRADAGADLSDLFEPVDRFEARLGYAAFTERARRYRPG